MTDSLKHATFSVEHRYALSPEQVFGAWADPKVKAEWFAGPGASHHLEFWVGGQEITQGDSEGGVGLRFASTYQEILPAERIVYSSTLSGDDVLATVSVTTIEFIPDGEGTRLLLTEYGVFLNELEEPAWREQGTRAWLDRLASQLTAHRRST